MSKKNNFIASTNEMVIEAATKIITASHDNKNVSIEHALNNILGVNFDQLKKIIIFVIDYLPNQIYLDKNQDIMNYLQYKLIKNLILFLIQEDITSKYFENSLVNFRDEILSELFNSTYVLK